MRPIPQGFPLTNIIDILLYWTSILSFHLFPSFKINKCNRREKINNKKKKRDNGGYIYKLVKERVREKSWKEMIQIFLPSFKSQTVFLVKITLMLYMG
jgi:hypothetical protein